MDAKGDTQVYESIREAELAMEPEDVKNGEFAVYSDNALISQHAEHFERVFHVAKRR